MFPFLGLCCKRIEVKNNHVENNNDKNPHLFTIYYQVMEKVNGHDYYKSDAIYPPSDLQMSISE